MYLNTLGKNELYQSLAQITDTTENCIKQYILKNKDDIINCHYDDISITSMDLHGFKKYVGCKKLKQIDKVILHHITPRKDITAIYKEGLLTLSDTLTKDTALATYLRKLGFTFDFVDNHILMKLNGESVNISKLNPSNLHVRFGDNCTVNDFNINAYLFINEFELHRVRGWLGSPEILKSIANAYGKTSIADDYADQCKNYLVSFKVSISKIDLEGFASEIEDTYKTELLVRFAIMALAYYETGSQMIFPMHNQVVYLKRNYNVPGDDVCKVWELVVGTKSVYPKKNDT